jgi:hypothetical protein
MSSRKEPYFLKGMFWPHYLHNADNTATQNLSPKICKFKYKCKDLRQIKFQFFF